MKTPPAVGYRMGVLTALLWLVPDVLEAQKPDLVPVDLQAESVVLLGDTIEITWEIANQGTAEAQGQWTDELRLSVGLDPREGSTVLTRVTREGPLPVGETYRGTLQCTLPAFAGLRSYYLLLTADPRDYLDELDQTNNTLPKPLELQGADLTLTWFEAPTTVGFDRPFEVAWAVTNSGNATAWPDWTDQLYLSTDDRLSAQDLALSAWVQTNALPPGASYSGRITQGIPSGSVPPGEHFLILRCNRDGDVPEPRATDNHIARPVWVTDQEPLSVSGDAKLGVQWPWELQITPPAGTDRVEFAVNDKCIGAVYGEPFDAALTRWMLDVTNVFLTTATRVVITAYDQADQPLAVAVVNAHPPEERLETRVEIEEPFRDYAIYTDGAVSPEHTMSLRVNAEVLGAQTVIVGGMIDTHLVWRPASPVEFYIDGALVHTSTGIVSADYPYHEFEYTSSGLALGPHVFYAYLPGTDTRRPASDSTTFYVEEAVPDLRIWRDVYPETNAFRVEVTLSNRGSTGTRLERLIEPMTGFQPCAASATLEITNVITEFSYPEKRNRLIVEFGADVLEPDTRCVVTYHAVPILFRRDCRYEFGGDDGRVTFWTDDPAPAEQAWDAVTSITSPWASRRDLSDAVRDAFTASDYLLLTDPVNLSDAYGAEGANGVLDDMAKLATYRNGVLGFYHTIGMFRTDFRSDTMFAVGNAVRTRENDEQLVLGFPADDQIRTHHENYEFILADDQMPLPLDLRPGDALAVGNVWPENRDGDPHPRSEILVARGEARPGYDSGSVSIYAYEHDPDPVLAKHFSEEQFSSGFESGGRLAAGEAYFVLGEPDRDEIFMANPDGEIQIRRAWSYGLLSRFTIDFAATDPFGVGNLLGNDRAEIVAGSTATDELLIYRHDGPDWDRSSEPAYVYAYCFGHALEPEDGLAIGDVCGDSYAEIILADASADQLVIIGYEPATDRFDVIDRFDFDFEPGDRLSTGYLASRDKEQMMILRGSERYGRAIGTVELIGYAGGEQPGDRWALDRLIDEDGLWADQLSPDWATEGYLLIVGENEIVPTFSKTWHLEDCDGGQVDFTDRNYASTDSGTDNNLPELALGRLPGNSAESLRLALQNAVEAAINADVLRNSYAYCLSGDDDDDADRFVPRRDEMADLLRDLGFVVTEDHVPNEATFTSHAAGKDVIAFAGHGNPWGCCGIGADWIAGQFDPGVKKPFVFAMSCLTGRYPAGTTLGERFIERGASAYLGATEISFGCYNDALARSFLGWITPSRPIGWSLKHTKRGRLVDAANPDDENWNSNRYHCAIYHYLGDPKMGIDFVDGALAPTELEPQGGPTEGPISELGVTVPPYVVTTNGIIHDVNIPGQAQILRAGHPAVPFYAETVHFPKGYRVQEVTLLERGGLVVDSGLNLPPVELLTDGAGGRLSPQDNGSGWWPEQDFAWSVSEHADGSSTVTIKAFPFYYHPQTTEVNFYTQYTFGIDYAESTVEILGLSTDRLVYPGGATVQADLQVYHTNTAPMTVDVEAVIIANECVTVAQLPTRRLANLKGRAWTRLSWESTGFAGGEYALGVSLRDDTGVLLDQTRALFVLSQPGGAITRSAIHPRDYRLGDEVQLSATFANLGTDPVEGAVVLEIGDAAGNLVTELRDPFTGLAAGASRTFDTVWPGATLVPRNCRVLAYAEYAGETTPRIVVADWMDAPLRWDEVRRSAQGLHLRWPSVAGRRYRLEFTPDLGRVPFALMAADLAATPPQNEIIDTPAHACGFYRVREE